MSETVSPDSSESLRPRQQSLLKSSMLMASGTLVSRILGFVKSAMMIAALGAFAGAAAAFQVANTLPNMVYNLLAAGILDAVLVPQIVRALRSKAGSAYVSKLITAVGTILFLLTILALVATPVLISILAPTLSGATRNLTITFAIWCVPQIFFYGLYNLFGQILNARGVFGPYMWAPALNNVIAIISLGVFLFLWGTGGEVVDAESFTGNQILVLAGSATLGVVAQALILILPIRRSGVSLRMDFRFRGTRFGSASKVASWTFATLIVSQIGVISTTQLATRADSWTESTGEIVAGFQAYQYAFMIFMVPQSLITVTLVTAIFTRLATHVGDDDFDAVARNFHRGVELVIMLCMAAAAALMVTATPIMQLIMPTLSSEAASIYGAVLVALMLGVPSTGISMMSQRVFFALEDAKPVFLMSIAPMALQLLVGWSIYFLASAQWWTIGASAAETAARIAQGFIALAWTSRVVTQIRLGRVLRVYANNFISFAISGLVGWGVMHLLGPGSESPSTLGRFAESMWKVIIVGVVVFIVYFALQRVLDPIGFDVAAGAIKARFRRGGPAEPVGETSPSDVLGSTDAGMGVFEGVAADQPGGGESQAREHSHSFPGSIDAEAPASWSQRPPSWNELFGNESVGHAVSQSLSVPDPSSTGALPALTGAMMIAVDPEESAEDLAEWIRDSLGYDPASGRSDSQPINHWRGTTISAGTLEQDGLEGISYVQPQQGRRNPRMGNPPRSAAGSGGRFNPTIPALILGLIVVVFAGWFALKTLTSPSNSFFDGLGNPIQSGEQSGQSEDAAIAEPPKTEDPSAAAPVLTSATVFSWADDNGDHPELSSALVDGDPNSMWRSRYFASNQFEDGQQIALLLKLQKPAVVNQIVIDLVGTGGEVVVRAAVDGFPRSGDILATAALESHTVIRLPQPTEVGELGLVFNTLPTDDEGRFRAKITNITVE